MDLLLSSNAALILPAALVLDLLLGDPAPWPHPIRWMGQAIFKAEPVFRRFPISRTRQGGAMALLLILATWMISAGLLAIGSHLHPVAGTCLAVLMLYYCISIKSLAVAGRGVWKALAGHGLQAARNRLKMIVGRDVQPLDEQGVIRATVETISENLVDGIVSPLFFFVLGGPALAMTYKMVNTLDSMIGYKNHRYIEFGRWAAKIDDAANYLPARLVLPSIDLAARFLSGGRTAALRCALTEGRRHHSPNSGYPEAAFAGALRLRLGGPSFYQGRQVVKPYLGSTFGAAHPRHILQSEDLMVLSGLIWGSWCWLAQITALVLGR